MIAEIENSERPLPANLPELPIGIVLDNAAEKIYSMDDEGESYSEQLISPSKVVE